MVKLGKLRTTSRSVVAPCSSITVLGMMLIVCGVLRSGSVNLGDEGVICPSTSTEATTPCAFPG
jgi:hypothetical protein